MISILLGPGAYSSEKHLTLPPLPWPTIKVAFVDWINYQLEEDADLKALLPVSEDGDALFQAVHNGLILW